MLEIKNLNFGFGEQLLYQNFNLSLDENKIYGILGRNGAGKTTLFRILYGWFKAKDSTITWKGSKLEKADISFLETDPYFYPYMTGSEYLNLINPNKQQQVDNLSTLLNLPLDKIVDSYSTGMKKKLAFLAIQLQEKPIQLLDEPFNGVDLESNEILKKLILEKGTGQLTILSSHIMNTLLDSCEEIIYLDGSAQFQIYQKTDFDKLERLVKDSINEKFEGLR